MLKRILVQIWLLLFVLGVGSAFAAPKVELGFASRMIGDKGPNAARIPILLTNTDTQDDGTGNLVPLNISAIGVNIQYDTSLIEYYSAEAADKVNKKADSNITDPGDTSTGKLANVRIAITGGQVLLPYSPTPVIIGYVNFNIKELAYTGFTTLVNLPDQASTPDAVKVDLAKGSDGSLEITDSNPVGGPLTTSVVGGTGLSSVTVDPLGFSYDPTMYNLGNKVILTAVPEDKYRFKNWSGDCAGSDSTANPFTLTMTEGPKSCTANFVLDVYKISLKTTPLSSGSTGNSLGAFTLNPLADSSAPGATNYTVYSYSPPTLLTTKSIVGVTLGNLSADYEFNRWNGQCTGTNPSIDVSFTDKLDKTCAAILNVKVTMVAAVGSISGKDWVDGSSSAPQVYTITPPAIGYAFSALKVNGATVNPTTGNSITYTFPSGIKIPTTIEAVFVASLADQAPLTVIVTPSTLAFGSTAVLSSTGGSGTGAVTFVATGGGCSVSDSILSVVDTTKTCSVTATKAADTTYKVAISAAAPVTLTKGTQATVTVTAPATATVGQTGLSAVAAGGSGSGAYSYSYTGTACSVNATTGALTFSATGSCSITATRATDNNYLVSAVTPTPAVVAVVLADQATLTAVVTPSTVTFGNTAALSSTGGSGTGAVTFVATG
ncbi:MAG: hypothetical protein WCP20_21240, partial [Desulfuromonadales bacterium]